MEHISIITRRKVPKDTPRRSSNDERKGGYTTLICLNKAHHDLIEYDVKYGESNACPVCGRGN